VERLEGRTAVLTGAAHGIGRATALALARAGVNVVVADIDLEHVSGVAWEIGESALALQCDVTSENDFARLREAALDRFGRVDIVVNTVGVLYSGWPTELSLDIWREVTDTNLLGCVRAYHAFAPLLLEQGEGHLVFTASAAGTYAYAYDRLPYATTKAAVISLSEGLALYLRPRGVGVTCLVPGSVATTMLDRMRFIGDEPPKLRSAAFSGLLDPDVVGEMVVDAIRSDTFWLLTHPEVQDSLVRRAQDPQAFVEEQTARIASAADEADGPHGALTRP
jgi:NAD(P)-dependent dehydrogenase (short-subunit alcohol dehydrogenase family)